MVIHSWDWIANFLDSSEKYLRMSTASGTSSGAKEGVSKAAWEEVLVSNMVRVTESEEEYIRERIKKC